MYKILQHNIQTGNDRIQKIKSKILFNEFKNRYKNNKKYLIGENNEKLCKKIKKIPHYYIKSNTNKLLITRGYLYDCSRNTSCCNKNIYDKNYNQNDLSCNLFPHKLNTNNNFYSKKTFNEYDTFIMNKSTTIKWDISKNVLYDLSLNDVNIVNNYNNTLKEKNDLLNKNLNNNINNLNNNNCYSQIKISSLCQIIN